MGIYDRHYIRDDGPRQKRPRARMPVLSVNTWIIVACVAVFVIDGFLPMRLVPMPVRWAVEDVGRLDQSTLIEGDVQQRVDPRSGRRFAVQPIYVPTAAGPQLVGERDLRSMGFLESYLHFSTQRGFLQVEFWRLIGFQFLHARDNMSHIIFNMIGLFFFGSIVERYLGSKRYLAFYLLCGICGALMYVLLNLAGTVAIHLFGLTRPIPGLLFNDMSTPLIGASAGVYGVIMAGAYLVPNAMVLVFFILPVRLATLAYIIVGIAFFTLLTGGNNAGGEAAHLGGALAGFYFVRHPHHLHGFFDILGRIDPTSHHYRGREGKGSTTGRPGDANLPSHVDPAAIDRILTKVHAKGLASLTEREKKLLREASER